MRTIIATSIIIMEHTAMRATANVVIALPDWSVHGTVLAYLYAKPSGSVRLETGTREHKAACDLKRHGHLQRNGVDGRWFRLRHLTTDRRRTERIWL